MLAIEVPIRSWTLAKKSVGKRDGPGDAAKALDAKLTEVIGRSLPGWAGSITESRAQR
jgi:hypothetical protein